MTAETRKRVRRRRKSISHVIPFRRARRTVISNENGDGNRTRRRFVRYLFENTRRDNAGDTLMTVWKNDNLGECALLYLNKRRIDHILFDALTLHITQIDLACEFTRLFAVVRQYEAQRLGTVGHTPRRVYPGADRISEIPRGHGDDARTADALKKFLEPHGSVFPEKLQRLGNENPVLIP